MTNKHVIEKTVFFNSSRQNIWEFLTNKDKLGAWYHPAEDNLTAGEDYCLYKIDDDGSHVKIVWGRVVEMQQPSKLVTTFCIGPFGDKETLVTWSLQEIDGGTKLYLRHEGIKDAVASNSLPLLMALDKGWDGHLSDMRGSFI